LHDTVGRAARPRAQLRIACGARIAGGGCMGSDASMDSKVRTA
jgi:hypothetical protein